MPEAGTVTVKIVIDEESLERAVTLVHERFQQAFQSAVPDPSEQLAQINEQYRRMTVFVDGKQLASAVLGAGVFDQLTNALRYGRQQ